MKRILAVAALVGSFALPAFAQPETIVCDDYLGMDNTQQMAAIAEIETAASEMAAGADTMTADQIHERLAADCKSQPDALIVEIVKEAKG
jgi:hypothetical protein